MDRVFLKKYFFKEISKLSSKSFLAIKKIFLGTSFQDPPLFPGLNGKEICEFRKAIFPVFYIISPPKFGISLFLKGFFFVWIWLDQKLVYNANRPLLKLFTLN